MALFGGNEARKLMHYSNETLSKIVRIGNMVTRDSDNDKFIHGYLRKITMTHLF